MTRGVQLGALVGALGAGVLGQAATGAAQVVTFVPGSTVRLEQLIGDVDKQRNAPTANRTLTRYGIQGTDLGYSFEHQGRLFFLFGDTLGRGGGDAIATSRTTDPERGLALDFLTDRSGRYLKVEPPGVDMRGFNVPVSGISLDGRLYVVVKTNHSKTVPTDTTLLTRFDESRGTFTPLRTLSRLPGGKVIKLSMREQPEALPGLPPGGPDVLVWSSAVYRASDAYLSVIPRAQFESGRGTRYFAGLDPAGGPTWSEAESDARPVVAHPTIGDLSVTWAPSLRLWLMLYDSREPRGVVFRHARTPWGPWSEAQMIFTPAMEARDPFIHRPGRGDRLAGPVIGEGRSDPEAVPGSAYAPYAIERFTRHERDTLTLYYVLSTWNPYVVVLMRSTFRVTGAGG